MLNVKALKAKMVERGFTQAALAEVCGITPRTFTNRLKTGDFGAKEIEIISETLGILDPVSIFFAKEVT